MTSFSETNRQAWNNLSAEYNTKRWQQRISQQVSEALQERKDWLGARWTGTDETGRDVRLLDYACGTGSITNALASYVDTIRGIDISENMVQKYNEAAGHAGMTPERCNATVGDLFTKSVSEHLTDPEFYSFDIAVIGLGFHHFENPGLAIKRLTERLKPGEGVLVIVDFLPFSKEDQMGGVHHTIKTHGFGKEDMKKMYREAGLEDFDFDVLSEPAIMEFDSGTKQREVFIAKGKREKGVWGKLGSWVSGLQDASSGHLKVASLPPDPEPRAKHDQFGRRMETVQPQPKGGYDFMGRRIE